MHIGVHAGDVIREEGNVFGGAVNIAARICSLSEAGEILVSDVVRGMARTSAGVVFEDRGEREMKGVGEAVRGGALPSGKRGSPSGPGTGHSGRKVPTTILPGRMSTSSIPTLLVVVAGVERIGPRIHRCSGICLCACVPLRENAVTVLSGRRGRSVSRSAKKSTFPIKSVTSRDPTGRRQLESRS